MEIVNKSKKKKKKVKARHEDIHSCIICGGKQQKRQGMV